MGRLVVLLNHHFIVSLYLWFDVYSAYHTSMHIVSVIAQKGGTGKTTLAISLAVAGHLAGRTVAIIDLDPQATASNWSDRRHDHEHPAVVSAQPARLPHVLQAAHAAGTHLVIIDTPPRAEHAALSAARAATLVLIPCRPAVFDLDTVATTLDLLKLSPTASIAAVLNAVPAAGDERTQATTILRELGLSVCPTALGLRKAYAQSAETGKSAQEFAPTGKAADEIRAVYRFVNRLLKETV